MKKHILKGVILEDYDDRLVYLNGERLLPDKSQKVINHSPDGFSWGYGGSGPAQLALAVLLQLMPEQEALKKYQDFKWKVIANLEMDKNFEIAFNRDYEDVEHRTENHVR